MEVEVPLLLVDGHNLLWRATFGFPAPVYSRDKARELTGVFAFFALLRVAIRDNLEAEPEVVVVFDGQHGALARQAADPAYKANRSRDAGSLKPITAFPDVKDGLDAYGLPWVEIEDVEADDVIGTLGRLCPGRQVLIMSGDRDYFQLVTDRVHVLNTARRAGSRLIGPEEIGACHGVRPHQWACLRALCGDRSDNIPGVKGVGPGTAASLLVGGLTLDDLPGSGRLVAGRGRDVLAAWEQVLARRELIRIRKDVAFDYQPTGLPSPALPKPAEIIEKLDLW